MFFLCIRIRGEQRDFLGLYETVVRASVSEGDVGFQPVTTFGDRLEEFSGKASRTSLRATNGAPAAEPDSFPHPFEAQVRQACV